MRHTIFPMPARRWGCGQHAAAFGRVLPQTHVQTGLVRTVVLHPSILPCIFPRPDGTGMRCPGGAASCAACQPASASHATGMARSGHAICTWERTPTCAWRCAMACKVTRPECSSGCCAKCGADVLLLHARQRVESTRNDTPDSTSLACGNPPNVTKERRQVTRQRGWKSVKAIADAPVEWDARRRSRWMHGSAQSTGCRRTPGLSR